MPAERGRCQKSVNYAAQIKRINPPGSPLAGRILSRFRVVADHRTDTFFNGAEVNAAGAGVHTSEEAKRIGVDHPMVVTAKT